MCIAQFQHGRYIRLLNRRNVIIFAAAQRANFLASKVRAVYFVSSSRSLRTQGIENLSQ